MPPISPLPDNAQLHWVRSEDGIAPDPNWYTLKKSDLATGVATAQHSDPRGDAYAPVEMDVPLLKKGGHKWFWAPNTDSLLLDLPQLMDIYYESVGRGGVLLLNSTPDTTGLIPESHVEVYRKFGEEIEKRFSTPLPADAGRVPDALPGEAARHGSRAFRKDHCSEAHVLMAYAHSPLRPCHRHGAAHERDFCHR